MLKLARNALATLRQIKAEDGIIDYTYIEKLIYHQEATGLRLANKLTRQHLNWQGNKMKVRLAAQVLSSSTADSLDYLRRNISGFKEAGPTINFIRKVRGLTVLKFCPNQHK